MSMVGGCKREHVSGHSPLFDSEVDHIQRKRVRVPAVLVQKAPFGKGLGCLTCFKMENLAAAPQKVQEKSYEIRAEDSNAAEERHSRGLAEGRLGSCGGKAARNKRLGWKIRWRNGVWLERQQFLSAHFCTSEAKPRRRQAESR